MHTYTGDDLHLALPRQFGSSSSIALTYPVQIIHKDTSTRVVLSHRNQKLKQTHLHNPLCQFPNDVHSNFAVSLLPLQ